MSVDFSDVEGQLSMLLVTFTFPGLKAVPEIHQDGWWTNELMNEKV
jgi:hypothetical protein